MFDDPLLGFSAYCLHPDANFLPAARAFQESGDGEAATAHINDFVRELRGMPLAIETDAANEQHYEVPTEYFLLCLGPHLKYSSCLYPKGDESLGEAEEAMLSERSAVILCYLPACPPMGSREKRLPLRRAR